MNANARVKRFKVRLVFLRALQVDPYPGDNNTKLPLEQRMYLGEDGKTLVLPSANLMSFLTAENTKSAPKVIYGKASPTILRGFATYVSISPMLIPLLDGHTPIQFNGFNEKVHVSRDVARLKGGIPNPKERVTIEPPLAIEFELMYAENEQANENQLRETFDKGGRLVGLGTHRPVYGQFKIDQWDEIA